MSLPYYEIYLRKQGDRAAAVAHMTKYADLVYTGGSTSSVLDFGCGWGHLLEALRYKGVAAEGIDIDPGQVSIASASGCKATHVEDSFQWIDERIAENCQWDTIYFLDVLEHLDADRQIHLLERFFEAIKPGGRLVIKTPNPDSVVGMRMTYSDYTHRFTPSCDALADALTAIGFSRVSITDELPWSPPYTFDLLSIFSRNAEIRKLHRRNLFYFLSKKIFRKIRRLQIGSEIGLEAATELPLAANYLCIADK